jgi:hypothetical protein
MTDGCEVEIGGANGPSLSVPRASEIDGNDWVPMVIGFSEFGACRGGSDGDMYPDWADTALTMEGAYEDRGGGAE